MRYRLYKSKPTVQRLHYYPKGIDALSHYLRILGDENGADSIAARIMKTQDLSQGACYITVPFDCPENLVIDSLEWGQFYFETERGIINEKYLGEVHTLYVVNDAIVEMVKMGTHNLLTLVGRATQEQFVAIQRHSANYKMIRDVAYGVAVQGDTEDNILSLLNDPAGQLRVVFRNELGPMSEEVLISAAVDRLEFVSHFIFDFTGYLLWWPTGRLHDDA